MKWKRPLVVAGTVVALLAAIAAITALTRDSKRKFVLPACARPAHGIAPPPEFPRAFPLPRGTVLSTVTRYSKMVVVRGRVPLDLAPATLYFLHEMQRKGFELGAGESEYGYEAESGFAGHGAVGRFKIRVLPACRGGVLLFVALAR